MDRRLLVIGITLVIAAILAYGLITTGKPPAESAGGQAPAPQTQTTEGTTATITTSTDIDTDTNTDSGTTPAPRRIAAPEIRDEPLREPPPPPPAATPIAGVKWILTTLRGQPVEPPAEGREPPHLIFSPERADVAGHTGCNRVMSHIIFDDAGTLTFKAPVTTRMACLDEKNETEISFVTALPNITTWSRDGDTLSLGNANGEILMLFKAEAAEGTGSTP